jgi:acyl-CoA synthetase (AMP-forming)/AMP-acid ligase II
MMSITQGLRRAVQINAKGTATIDGNRRYTWGEFAVRVAKLAGALRDSGLKPEDRVAMLALNSDRHLEYYFATIWAGGIFVPLNTRHAPPEIDQALADAGADILVIDDLFQDQLPKLFNYTPVPGNIIFAGENQSNSALISHESLLNTSQPIPDAGRQGDDVATILYSSGTTGLPKGVMLTHANAVSNALSALAIMGVGEPWTYLHVAPMFHIADSQWNSGITIQGGTHVFARKFVPEETLGTINRHKITHMAVVPAMLNMLCNVPNIEDYDVSSLMAINFGGSAITPDLIRRARSLFPLCKFIQGYGQTETSANISMLLDKYNTDEGPFAGKIESAGQPVFPVEVKIVDSEDQVLPAGAVGEIATSGPHVMAGYWKKPEATAYALRGGWMHTGDVGYIDEDGFLYIVDRLKDMIITGGENVYSTEVEFVICQHPSVAECAIIAIPDEQWGETVHAIVVLHKGQHLNEADVANHCRQQIAGYKCPRSVEFRVEPLPRSASGKVLKKDLRAPFWEGKERQIN